MTIHVWQSRKTRLKWNQRLYPKLLSLENLFGFILNLKSIFEIWKINSNQNNFYPDWKFISIASKFISTFCLLFWNLHKIWMQESIGLNSVGFSWRWIIGWVTLMWQSATTIRYSRESSFHLRYFFGSPISFWWSKTILNKTDGMGTFRF